MAEWQREGLLTQRPLVQVWGLALYHASLKYRPRNYLDPPKKNTKKRNFWDGTGRNITVIRVKGRTSTIWVQEERKVPLRHWRVKGGEQEYRGEKEGRWGFPLRAFFVGYFLITKMIEYWGGRPEMPQCIFLGPPFWAPFIYLKFFCDLEVVFAKNSLFFAPQEWWILAGDGLKCKCIFLRCPIWALFIYFDCLAIWG